ncbi:unnamed protein product [Mortierella alpina]
MDHTIVELSAATPGSPDEDVGNKKYHGHTASSIPIEAVRTTTGSTGNQQSPATPLLQKQQSLRTRTRQTVPEFINSGKGAVGAGEYKASMNDFKVPGDYSAIWSVSVPAFYRIGERTTLVFKGSHGGGRMEVSGLWKKLREEKYDSQEQQICGSTQECRQYQRQSCHCRSDRWQYSKSRHCFLFEMRPWDSNGEQEQEQEQEQNGSSILSLPVTRRALTLIPPSVLDKSQEAQILAIVVSQDEKTAATVSRTGSGVEFFLDLWDLNGHLCFIRNKKMSDLTASVPRVAWAEFTADGVEGLDMSSLNVALSSNGDLVTVFDQPQDTDSTKLIRNGFQTGKFPLRVFQRKSTATITAGSAEFAKFTTVQQQVSDKETSGFAGSTGVKQQATPPSKGMEEVLYDKVSPLFTFAGFAKFQDLSGQGSSDKRRSTDPREFVLVTCNGRCLEVYETRAGIKQLYALSLIALSLNEGLYESYKLLMKTLQSSMFVWYVNDQEISVWNWWTGKNVGYFPKGCKPVLSTDESLLVMFRDSLVSTHSTTTGQLQSLRTNICWSYWEQEYVHFWYDVLSQGSKWLTMVLRYDQDVGNGCTELVRFVNMHNLEDIQEMTFDLPLRSRLIQVLPSSILNQQNAIGTVIVGTYLEVELLNPVPNKKISTAATTPTVCGSDCSEPWKHGPKQNSFYDEEQESTFRFIKDYKRQLLRLVLIRGKSGSNVRGATLLQLPFQEERYPDWTILQDRNQCYVFTGSYFELWQLPTSAVSRCTLLRVGYKSDRHFVCTHGGIHSMDYFGHLMPRFGTSNNDLSGPEDTIAIRENIRRYTDHFETFHVTYRKAVVEFISRHINKDPGHSDGNKPETDVDKPRTSFMWEIVLECVRSGKDALLLGVLGSDKHLGYWIPSSEEFSADARKDMIAHLIAKFKLPVAKILIDYCLERAHSIDPMLLEKLMISVPHLIPKHPDIALSIARRAAFLPVLSRDQLLQQAVFNGVQWRRGKLWAPPQTKLYEVIDRNPVFHRLNRLAIFDRTKVQDFEKMPGLLQATAETVKKNADIKANLYMAPFRWLGRFKETNTAAFTRLHYEDLRAYDNPAFSALMTYKWTRFAGYFWCFRLLFQVSYEILVIVVTLLQLYEDEEQRANLVGGYITVIVLGYMLLHLEFQQMRGGIGRYISSPYNYVDLCAYVIPVISSCILVANSDHIMALRALSFSVVLIYIHFIFELRVFKNVCRVVTIVVNILSGIPAFFIILAIFILSFAHSINHLTEINFRAVGCVPDPEDAVSPSICNAQRKEFPREYLQAASATYFFMTGDYGPVQTSLTNGHWTIQLMVSVFFFLTAVLMMNVVIALMNGVYTETIPIVDQIWIKNRLELIAQAESLTFFLPYFRNHFDYFPKWVYYTATDKEVEEYRRRYGLDEMNRRSMFRSEEDNEEEGVEEELEEDSEWDDDGEMEKNVAEKNSSSDIAGTVPTDGQVASDASLPSPPVETQTLLETLKKELSEIKDRMVIQDKLWLTERNKQQERLDFQELEMKAERALQDQRYQKLEDMLKQTLMIKQRSI